MKIKHTISLFVFILLQFIASCQKNTQNTIENNNTNHIDSIEFDGIAGIRFGMNKSEVQSVLNQKGIKMFENHIKQDIVYLGQSFDEMWIMNTGNDSIVNLLMLSKCYGREKDAAGLFDFLVQTYDGNYKRFRQEPLFTDGGPIDYCCYNDHRTTISIILEKRNAQMYEVQLNFTRE